MRRYIELTHKDEGVNFSLALDLIQMMTPFEGGTRVSLDVINGKFVDVVEPYEDVVDYVEARGFD